MNPLDYPPLVQKKRSSFKSFYFHKHIKWTLFGAHVCVELVVPVGFPQSKRMHISPTGVRDWSRVTHDPDV